MSIDQTLRPRLLAAVDAVCGELAGVREVQPVYLATGEKEALLVGIAAAEAQLAELRLRTVAASADVADEHGSRHVSGWLAKVVHADPVRLRADERLANVAVAHPLTTAAMADGEVNLDQARVIVGCIDSLPVHICAEVREKAERELIGFAHDFGPADLRRLGRAILHVSCPEIADEEDARRLQEQEQRAEEKTSLRFRTVGDGTTRINMTLPDADAARFATCVDSWANPRVERNGSDTDNSTPTPAATEEEGTPGGAGNPDEERLPRHRRLGEAFRRLLEHLNPDAMPEQGGDATTIVVTMTLAQLLTGLGASALMNPLSEDGVTEVSAEVARRMACNAQLIPAVLGGKGEVLDLGRRQRLFSRAIRTALRLKHSTCTAEGCTIPARWCDAHHLVPWSAGGVTSLENATLLCGFHHRRIHDGRYENETLADGQIRFRRLRQ